MIEDIINAVNLLSLGLFVLLLVAAVGRMVARLILYWREEYKPSIILRRDFALFGALALVFGSAAIIRGLGWTVFFSEPSWLRLIYILASDVIALGALGYWTWAEYFVIGKPGKEKD